MLWPTPIWLVMSAPRAAARAPAPADHTQSGGGGLPDRRRGRPSGRRRSVANRAAGGGLGGRLALGAADRASAVEAALEVPSWPPRSRPCRPPWAASPGASPHRRLVPGSTKASSLNRASGRSSRSGSASPPGPRCRPPSAGSRRCPSATPERDLHAQPEHQDHQHRGERGRVEPAERLPEPGPAALAHQAGGGDRVGGGQHEQAPRRG